MEMLINILLIGVSLSMLYFGASWLVNGASALAARLKISSLVVGLTVVAFGTSSPELAVSVDAALRGFSDISLGNVVGSNIVNIGLILGISAIIAPLSVHKNLLRKEIPIVICVAIILIPFSVDGKISLLEGIFLIGGIAAFTYFSYKSAKNQNQSLYLELKPQRLVKTASLIGFGLVLLASGSFLIVDNSVIVAKQMGVSERVIGLTLVAIGTSLPELITSVVAARRGQSDLSIGNIVGSNIFNVLAIIGIAASISQINVNESMFLDYVVMIAFSLVLIPLIKTKFVIKRIEGAGLVTAYVIYTVFLFVMPKI